MVSMTVLGTGVEPGPSGAEPALRATILAVGSPLVPGSFRVPLTMLATDPVQARHDVSLDLSAKR